MNFVEYQKFVKYQKTKGKNVNKVSQKQSNMSINTLGQLVCEKFGQFERKRSDVL